MSDYQYNALKAMRKLPIFQREYAYRSAKQNYKPSEHGDYETYCKRAVEALKL